MTISATYSPDTYAGNGSTDTFAITFAFLSVSTNVKVSIKVNSTGVITTKTAATHYNVSGSNVVFTAGNIPASGETVIIELNPDFKQESDYTENSTFPAETLETDLDERCLESQINNNLINGALRLDADLASSVTSTIVASSTVANNADKYIKFNSAGDGFEIQTLSVSSGLGNLADDLTPQLGADLDANSFDIQFDDATGIRDDSDNEQLIFQKTTSAVNHVEITNAATGNAPTIAAAGDDTNAGLTIDTKGTGSLTLGTSDTTAIVTGTNIDMNGKDIYFDDGTGIRDDAGNETLQFEKITSAVNFTRVTNAATGNDVKISAQGSDTNVGLDLVAKGTGSIDVTGQYLSVGYGATGPGAIRFLEDSDNGTNYIGFAAPAALTGDTVFTLPDGDGTSGQVLQTNASGTLSWGSKIANVVEDTTPQLGGTLDVNGNSIGAATGDVTISPTAGECRFTWSSTDASYFTSGNASPFGVSIYFSGASPDDNTKWFLDCTDSTTTRCRIYSDGDLQNHDNSYGAISDRRLKQNIVDASSQWDDIKALKVKKYKFKSDVEAYGDKAISQIGVIAQELAETSPGLVQYHEDDDIYSVQYSVLYMKAVKALQEALVKIEELESRIEKLEG